MVNSNGFFGGMDRQSSYQCIIYVVDIMVLLTGPRGRMGKAGGMEE